MSIKEQVTEELVSIGEAARMLGVNKETLRRWDRQGKLKPDIRIGTRGDRRYKIKLIKKIIA